MSIKIMTWIWENSLEEGTNLLMLLAIADHANDDGVCWPSIERLAQRARVKERQAQYIIKNLEANGAIEVQRGVGRNNTSLYFVKGAPDCTFSQKEKVQSSVKKVQSSALKGAVAIAPEPLEPSIEPSVIPLRANNYRNQQFVSADSYTQEAVKAGLTPAQFVAIFNLLIDTAGWRALVDAGDDTNLNYAKQGALTLIKMGTDSEEKVSDLITAYKATHEWRVAPKPRDITEYASQLAAGISSSVNGKMQKGKGNSSGTYRKADSNSSQHISSAEAEYVMPAKYR
jgi:DNA-binding transcriptional regulator YhcF (GntR family)